MTLGEIARREGLLAIESALELEDVRERYALYTGLRMIIDGTDTKHVVMWFDNVHKANVAWSPSHESSLQGILDNMIKIGCLMIQDGMNPRFIRLMIESCLPSELRAEWKDVFWADDDNH